MLRLRIKGVDYAPVELERQTPLCVEVLRQLPGPDRSDYWLGRLEQPLLWTHEGSVRRVDHLLVATRHVGTRVERGVRSLPVNLAVVVDPSLLDDAVLDFQKCVHVAVGTVDDAALAVQEPSQVPGPGGLVIVLRRVLAMAPAVAVAALLLYLADELLQPLPLPAAAAVLGGLVALWERPGSLLRRLAPGVLFGLAAGMAVHCWVHLRDLSPEPAEGLPVHLALDGLVSLGVSIVVLIPATAVYRWLGRRWHVKAASAG